MDSIKIPFCNYNGMLIKNDRNKYSILRKINDILNYDILNFNKNIYSSRKLKELKHKYTICTYVSSGKECFLYLTKIHNENVSLIIELSTNKKNRFPKITSIPLHFNSKLYDGTLFYGELYRNDNHWYYLIESIKIMNGRKYNNNNQYKNILILHRTIDEQYKYIPGLSPLEVVSKKFVAPNKLNELLVDTNIKIKGVAFISNNKTIYYYLNKYIHTNNFLHVLPYHTREETLQEINEALEMQTQDISKTHNLVCSDIFILTLKKSNTYGIYHLYSKNKYEDVYIGIARTDTIEISLILLDLFKKRSYHNVSCIFDNKFNKFKIIELSNKPLTSYVDLMKKVPFI